MFLGISRLQQMSLIKHLVVEKCKPFEILQECEMHTKKHVSSIHCYIVPEGGWFSLIWINKKKVPDSVVTIFEVHSGRWKKFSLNFFFFS